MAKKQTGIVIKADGTTGRVVPNNGREFSLRELQMFVGGYIEITYTKDHRLMYVNEEGKIHNLPINKEASRLYRYAEIDPIVGDVVIIEEETA